jgi:MFS family permease
MSVLTSPGPLRSPAFRRYLTGQLPSVTGSWAQVVALSWCVVELDPSALGWVVALQFAPTLLLGPWFGALADRHDRRRTLMLAEAGLGLVAAGYAVAAAGDRLTLGWIYALAAVWGVLNALDTPARQALIPALVRPEQAARAGALAGVVLLVGMTAGSALGAAMVSTVGPATAFAVNAASFAVDVALLATIRAAAVPRVARAPRQLRDGLAYVWRTAPVRAALGALALVGTLGFTVQVSVPMLARSFAADPALVGAAFTAGTAGALAGAVFAAVRGRPGPRRLPGACAVMAAALAVTAAAPSAAVMLGALVGVGFAWSVLIAATVAVLQTTPPTLLGRVMSWLGVVIVGGTAAGGPLAGLVAAAAGPRAPFAIGAAASVVAVLVASHGRRPAEPAGRDEAGPAGRAEARPAGPVGVPMGR